MIRGFERMTVAVVAVILACVGFIVWPVVIELTEPDAGTVYDKTYRGAYTTISCSGKPQVCTSTYYPDCWRIMYRDDNGDAGDDCVSEDRYRRTEVGAWFSKDAP